MNRRDSLDSKIFYPSSEDDPSSPRFQLSGWACTLPQAFERCGAALSNYIIEISSVTIRNTKEIMVTGHDAKSLLYNFMMELLALHQQSFVCRKVEIVEFIAEEVDFMAKYKCHGEQLDLRRHFDMQRVKTILSDDLGIYCNPASDSFEVYVTIEPQQ